MSCDETMSYDDNGNAESTNEAVKARKVKDMQNKIFGSKFLSPRFSFLNGDTEGASQF